MLQHLNPPTTLLTGSGKNSVATQKATIRNCPPEKALDYATLLLGCYRKAECDDPEVFVTAAIAVLTHYPEDVVKAVIDPFSGLPSRSKWVPQIPEIREACDGINAAARRREEQATRIKAQFAERERMEALEPSERRRAFIKREMAKVNAVFASADPDKPPPPLDIREMEECAEKQALRSRLNAEIAAKSRDSASTPMRLSPAVLATLGITARPDAESAGAGR
jgi:hypothetical protein